MNGRECFELWAGDNQWSDWTKPTLFAGAFELHPPFGDEDVALLLARGREAITERAPRGMRAIAADNSQNCVVVDLPGKLAVAVAAALAEGGFAPVVLFNGVSSSAQPLIHNEELVRALGLLAKGLNVAHDAPPAFVLDSRRMDAQPPPPGWYDNRWITFPQDFPSGGRLLASGIKRCYLLSENQRVADDLAHVLRRWQDAGIEIHDPSAAPDAVLDVKRPLWFRELFYRWSALSRLRANTFGGFGGTVPQPSSRGVGFYG